MNTVFLIGRLTADPELRTTNSGKSVTTFTLAVPKLKRTEADFFICVAWGMTAELITQYMRKGNRVAVMGRLSYHEYEANGVKREYSEIVVNDVEFLTERTKTEQNAPAAAPTIETFDDLDDDIPF